MSVLASMMDGSLQATTLVAMRTDKKDEWYVALTYFEEETAIFTVTSTHRNLHEATRIIETARVRIDSDYAAGWLSLPNMGDFTVEYHNPGT